LGDPNNSSIYFGGGLNDSLAAGAVVRARLKSGVMAKSVITITLLSYKFVYFGIKIIY
jgi:hypothetical protein